MKENQLRESLEHGVIQGQYLVVGTEPLLIDRAVDKIRKALGGEAPFDIDNFSLPDAEFEEIIARLHLAPFQLTRRLLIVRDIERVSKSDLGDFAKMVNARSSGNCVVLTLRLEKDVKDRKKSSVSPGDLEKAFPNAEVVTAQADAGTVRGWIKKKASENNIMLDDALVRYLEEEFRDDITGLRNEIAKITNYLHEASRLDRNTVRDLARGLGDYDKYEMASFVVEGRSDALRRFEETYPFMLDVEFAPVLARRLLNQARQSNRAMRHDRNALADLLAQLSVIDRKVKLSSPFARLSMELYIMRNTGVIMNGASHGR
jgi:DNA polymerase III delta subunit